MSKPVHRKKAVPVGVEVLCAYTELVSVEKIIPNPRNPNKHPESQIMMLAKIIQAQGFRRPIIVSKRSGFITVGHARYQAAKYLGMDKEYADMIADNRIAELAERDTDMLKELLIELKDGDLTDIELTGFTHDDLTRLLEEFHFDPIDEQSSGGDSDADILAAKIVIKVKDTAIFDEFRNEIEKFIYEHWTLKQIVIVDR